MGEESDEEGASSWVERSREKEKLIKKEKEFADAGDQFGLGDLVKQEFKSKERTYTEKDLKVFCVLLILSILLSLLLILLVILSNSLRIILILSFHNYISGFECGTFTSKFQGRSEHCFGDQR